MESKEDYNKIVRQIVNDPDADFFSLMGELSCLARNTPREDLKHLHAALIMQITATRLMQDRKKNVEVS